MRRRVAHTRIVCATVVAALLTLTTTRAWADRKPITGICAGCFATVPASSEPAPLLVTLHGDWGVAAADLHAAWERFAKTRDVAVLSLTCPTDLGCKRSWWEWNGDPSWITDQVARLEAQRAIDHERMWIAGWSGGATYMGMRSQELERTFVGLVMHGGGHAPMRAGCAPEKSAVVFLAGDQNPLHARVLKLRDHYEACGNDLTFTLLRGAEHDAEWRALDKHGARVLDLLLTKRRVAIVAPPVPPPLPLASSPPPPPPPAAPTLPPRAGCGCDVVSPSSPTPWLAALGVVVLALGRRLTNESIKLDM